MDNNFKKSLLLQARKQIAKKLEINFENYNNFKAIDLSGYEEYSKELGNFVTLSIGGDLRGCIGQIVPSRSIGETISENAINSAFRDHRFKPLSNEEFSKVDIEISILTKPISVNYSSTNELLNNIEVNKDGIIISKGFSSSTFLPQVWEDLKSKEEFLSHLCMKAGLSYDEWTKGELELQKYQVTKFSEKQMGLEF